MLRLEGCTIDESQDSVLYSSFVCVSFPVCLCVVQRLSYCVCGTCAIYISSSVAAEYIVAFYLFVQYSDVRLALKRGDLRLLRHALQQHEDR